MPTTAANPLPESLAAAPDSLNAGSAPPAPVISKRKQPLPPIVAAWRRRRCIKRFLIPLVYLAAILSLALYLFSISTRWGTFIVTSPVTSGPGADPTRVNRWEEHLLIGGGMLRLHPMYVYTWGPDGFNTPHADLNSKSLAWAVTTNGSTWPTFEWNWGASGLPIAHLPLWPLAFATVAPAAWLTARLLSRTKPWQCAKCRYDLRGQPGTDGLMKCPECGHDRTCVVCNHPTIGAIASERCPECGWTTAAT
ncbi:MAG: hypothetical protein ACREJO_04725 [Phycisphaerales bacterium]